MAPRYRWSDPEGRRTIIEIVKKKIPEWDEGLHLWQLKLVIRILDGEDVLCCIATGAGKSALFAVPIIILREMAANPQLYPDLPVRALPMGIVITPTKGLAANIVLELKKLRVPAFAYCQDTVTEAPKAGRNLVREIKECKTWNIICVDPEHLREKAWREISASDTVRANLVYGCVDEAHLINQWGAEFRPLFKHIGAFFRGHFSSSISIMAISATIQPGASTKSICDSLGINERPNTQFIMEPLANGVSGTKFPQLIPYLNSGRKAVIHCRTIADVFRVFVYLWNALPANSNRLQRLQMYHSLRSFEDNEEILRLLEEDPRCQIVIATIAFSNGLNVKALLDSISIGFPDTVDQLWQEKGRVGRDPNTSARGVVLYQPKVLLAARKQLAGPVIPTDLPESAPKKGRKSKRPKKVKPMEHAKALVLVEENCYIVALNRIYGNPPENVTLLNCIVAKRRLPCSLCATRNKTTLSFLAPPLPSGITLPPFSPSPSEQTPSSTQKKLKLTNKEREQVEPALVAFGETVRLAERKSINHQNRPKSSFFPASVVTAILDKLLSLHSRADLFATVESWVFAHDHSDKLYLIVQKLQKKIRAQREQARLEKNAKQRATRQARNPARKKTTRDFDSEQEDEEEDDEEAQHEGSSSSDDETQEHPRSSPIPPPAKRSKTALKEVTNQKRPPRARATKKVLESAAAVTETYRPQYRTSRRRAAEP
ncbi:P-loop containing nucleoside triphosphate hydrolase protein [Mycena latifolia]|nr:P-loop containing nucleoside triphosphate hydrolase protein [Mycena latifolia]